MSAWLDPYANDPTMQIDSSPRGIKRRRADAEEDTTILPAAPASREDHSEPLHGLQMAMVSTIYARALGFFTDLWTYITGAAPRGERNITIITSPSGSNKRRYFEQETPKNVYQPTLPGQFPTPSIILTPPPSRPSSSASTGAKAVAAETNTPAISATAADDVVAPEQVQEQAKPIKWPARRRGEVDEYILKQRQEREKAYEILDDKTRKYTEEDRNRYRVHFWEAQRICEARRIKRIEEQRAAREKAEQERKAGGERVAEESKIAGERAAAEQEADVEKTAHGVDAAEIQRVSTREQTPPSSLKRSQKSSAFSHGSRSSPQPFKIQKAYRKFSDRRTVSSQEQHRRDSLIDGLIGRAKRVGINSPDSRAVHDYRRLKEALAETERLQREQIKLRERKEQLRLQKEREAAAAAEEERARQAAAQELEAQKKTAAEEQARQKVAAEEEKARQRAADRAAAQAQLEAEAEEAEIAFCLAESQTPLNHLLIRPLEDEWDDRIRAALASNNGNKQVALSKNGTALSRADFGRLVPTGHPADPRPAGWLNDEIVNAWFEEITAKKDAQTGWKKNSKDPRAFVAYNSGWITTWQRNGGAQAIKSWSRRQGIAGDRLLLSEKIFFPVNNGSHWTLLVISPRERKIEYLDSLHGSGKAYFKMAREWLAMELGKAYVASEWTDSPVMSNEQLNMSDCGAFACLNALAAAKGFEYSAVKGVEIELGRRLMAAVLLNGGLNGEFEL